MNPMLAGALFSALINVPGQVRDRPLEGCAGPEALRTALANLHKLDWRVASLNQVSSAWPSELAEKECDPSGCREVWAQDRIIHGMSECCAVFDFSVQGTPSAPRTEWLGNLIVRYSVTQRMRAVELAKSFAEALGLDAADARQIGVADVVNFDWEIPTQIGPEMSAIEVRVER
jgi:hypothetical protein